VRKHTLRRPDLVEDAVAALSALDVGARAVSAFEVNRGLAGARTADVLATFNSHDQNVPEATK
jgi:hypothetical protein